MKISVLFTLSGYSAHIFYLISIGETKHALHIEIVDLMLNLSLKILLTIEKDIFTLANLILARNEFNRCMTNTSNIFHDFILICLKIVSEVSL